MYHNDKTSQHTLQDWPCLYTINIISTKQNKIKQDKPQNNFDFIKNKKSKSSNDPFFAMLLQDSFKVISLLKFWLSCAPVILYNGQGQHPKWFYALQFNGFFFCGEGRRGGGVGRWEVKHQVWKKIISAYLNARPTFKSILITKARLSHMNNNHVKLISYEFHQTKYLSSILNSNFIENEREDECQFPTFS